MRQGLQSTDIEQLDQSLADWKDRLSHVDENLMALEQQPTLRMLDGAALEGETEKRVAPALATLRELFLQRRLLSDTLSRAQQLRQPGARRKPSPEKMAEIQRLLTGASITLPPLQTPIGQRDLLTASERNISPENLLTAMTQAFETARDAVMQVDRAWLRLSTALEEAGDQVLALDTLARSLGEDASAELTDLRTELGVLRGWVARDPLGAETSLDGRLSPLIDQIRVRLEILSRERQQVTDEQDRAHALLTDLRSTHAAGRQAYDRFQREIARAEMVPPIPDATVTEGLAVWLTTIDSTVASGRWSAAKVGLSHWLQAAESQLTTERLAMEASAGPVALREELLGRISARRAQMRALLLRGQPINPELDARARELEEMLEQVPTQIEKVTPLVEEFESDLAPVRRAKPADVPPVAGRSGSDKSRQPGSSG
jgi:hypothetical protein